MIFALVILPFALVPLPHVSCAGASSLTVKAYVLDIETGLPIPNVTASFGLTTREEIFFISESDLFTLQGITADDGSIVWTLDTSEVPSEPIRLFIASLHSQPPGVWIVERIVGDREYSLWGAGGEWEGPGWMVIQPDQLHLNVSTYVFPVPVLVDGIRGRSEIEVSFYLRRGRLVNLTLINPFHGDDPWYLRAVPSFLWRGYFDERSLYYRANRYLDGNFAPVDNMTLVVAPLDRPLEGTAFVARVSGLGSWGRFGEILSSWSFDFSFDVEEGDELDLTPRALQSISWNCQNDISSMLEDLKGRGFSVSSYRAELGKIGYFYEQAISAFEEQKTSEGVVFSRKADELYSSLVSSVQRVPTLALPSSGWIILTLLFFSFSLSCLATEERTKALILFDLLFVAVFIVFVVTQPYLKLFLSNPVASFQRIDTEFLSAFMQIGLPAIVATLFLALSKLVRDIIRQSFGVALKNLRRRKVRTVLTLTVILVITASAICLISTGYPLRSMSARIPLEPLVAQGLVIYKYNFGVALARPLSFQPFEIDWLAQQEWVEASTIYGVKLVTVSNSTLMLQRYNQFYLAAVNESFLGRFANAAEVFGSQGLNVIGQGSLLVGKSIAEAYQLEVGSEILIDGEAFTVGGTFDEAYIGDNLLDIDGDRLLYRVYNPATKTIEVPPTVYPPYPQTGSMAASFLIGSVDDFGTSNLPIYKVGLVVNPEAADYLGKIVEEILWASYEKGEDYVSTFSIYQIEGGEVTVRYLTFETLTLVGSWQTQVAPLVICALIVFVTLHGSVYERRSEIKTLSALGLSPLRVRMMFLTEGLTLGVIGGVLGYVLGFGLIRLGNITLLEGIEENVATGTPLLISMLIAVLVSIAGCLLPAKEAVLLAVPSKELLKKYAGIIDVRGNLAVLDVPLRVSTWNLTSFNTFMKDVAKRYPSTSTPHGLFAIDFSRKETLESVDYDIIVCYASERTAHYLVRVTLLKETEPMRMKTLIFPLDGSSLEVMDRWTVDHEHLLPRLAPILRQDLLSYIERK